MQLKGVIFDKDGTLFDYYTVWASVLRANVRDRLVENNREQDEKLMEDFLKFMGIIGDTVHPKGIIFKHNGLLMFLSLLFFSIRHHLSFSKLLHGFKKGYYNSKDLLLESLSTITPPEWLIPLFKTLKNAGYVIGIVTSDNRKSTDICLEHFGVAEYIDFISTYEDHFAKKPNPESFKAFCATFSLLPEEVAIVGDTSIDMKYGIKSKAGYRIGVLTGSKDIKSLTKLAHVVYPDISYIQSDSNIFPAQDALK